MNEFDNLEKNIGRAIEVIQSLFQKSEELHKKNISLNGNIAEQNKVIQQLREENQQLKNNTDYSNLDKENKIRIKIHHIIDKLESFEKLSNNH